MKKDNLEKLFNKLNSLDINKLQIFIKRLWAERVQLYKMLDLLNDGILILGEDWSINYSNRPASELFGIGESSHILLTEYVPDLAGVKKTLTKAKVNNSFIIKELEIFYPHKKTLNISGTKLETAPNNYIYALVVTDASETQKMIKQQVENERFSTITLLAGGVAHEIGNPLSAISLRLQLMQKQLNKIEQSDKRDKLIESVTICKEEIARLDGIIKNFLQAIRPQKPVMHPVDLNLIIDHVLKILSPEISNLQIKITKKTPTLPLILGDKKQLEEAVFNIIKNSIEAVDPHGQIDIVCSYTELQVLLEISDNGHGIAEENLQKISEPYFSTKQTGNGLGMMIVERILQEHRAIFTIQSNLGRGTKISIIFPIKDPSLPLFAK